MTATPTRTSDATLLMGDLLTEASTMPTSSQDNGGTFAPASLDEESGDRRYEVWGGVLP